MTQFREISGGEDWKCEKCGIVMEPGKVNITYLGSNFTVELLKCSRCGLVLIS